MLKTHCCFCARYITVVINAPQPDHIYHFASLEDVEVMIKKADLEVLNKIYCTANNVSLEKALKKKYAIVAGLTLKKQK